jgi:hypothetical protein
VTERKKISLAEFKAQLEGFLERGGIYERFETVAIPLAQPSIGSSAITGVSGGFDWDRGVLFIHTQQPLIRAVRASRDEIREVAAKRAAWLKEHGGFAYKKSDVYREGYYDGACFGMLRLLEENSK